MNAHDADPLQPDSTDTPVPEQPSDTPEAAKPKRRRSVRKPAEALGSPTADAAADGAPLPPDTVAAPPLEAVFPRLAVLAEVDSAAGAVDPAPAVRPARASRARKPSAATLAAQAAGAAEVSQSAEEVETAEAGAAPSVPPAGFDAEAVAAAGQGSDAGSGLAPTPDEASAGDTGDTGEAGASGEASAPPRKGRNRRRGRRGSERGDGAADGGAAAARESGGAGAADEGGEGGEGTELGAEGAAGPRGARGPRGPHTGRPEHPVTPPVDPGELFAEVLSGAFDAEVEADAAEAVPPKRVLAAERDAPKLHKVLAQAGVGSRRDMEQKIVEGRITVNGEPAHTGQRISFGDRIAIDGKPVRVRIAPPPARVIAYHKPVGEVVTHDDPQQRPTVFRRLPRLYQGKWQSVGRLDINTEGLLLFTNSGELANQLMHPRFGVEREYAVRSLGVLSSESKARLLEGVEIDGQACSFKSVEDGGGEGVNHWYRVVITEGRNREVRRLFEAVGHAVSRLIRIRYGSVVLPRGLKRGVWVDMDDHDLRALRRLTQPVPGQAAGSPRPEAEGEGAGEGASPRRKRRGGRRGGRDERGPREGQEARAPQAPHETREPRETRDLREALPPHEPREPRPPRLPREAQAPRPAIDFDDDSVPANVSHLPPDPSGKRPKPGRGQDRPARGEAREGGAIPNPLQQTYDKRAIQQERALRRDMPDDGPIPNPLQQTYDKRALQQARNPQRDMPDDGPIPNPLQQTYDKRFAQGRGPGLGGGKGAGKPGGKGGGKFGKPGSGPNGGKPGGKLGRGPRKAPAVGGGGQPDPLKTAVGYIGGDAFLRKGPGSGGGGRGGQRPRTGGGAGGGGSGGGGGGGGGGAGGGGRRGGRSR